MGMTQILSYWPINTKVVHLASYLFGWQMDQGDRG